MTAAASIGISAVVNALAFTGGSYLFHMLDKNGSLDEMKRHSKALENLAIAKETGIKMRWRVPL